ncbi:AMP-binding protein [Streptomyces mirabilis]|uniref:AMP-binding protein n=1 Tax=Streptomyces mirabilis TaxID=68239 RepID=A0ABU3V5G0_9ACTN|nr:AMP-binding protein [Streptomyces mirabilis]MCX5355764.1 AMP-binding protein [Streptomyces mirabilis]MDU9001406.1 AMP-binding protein [Streptomyces mirabilis]
MQRFELQVAATPNRFAHTLLDRDVRAEQIVALVLPRSVELVVASLRVLKAGAAFLPVDPDYPADRIAYMLRPRPPCTAWVPDGDSGAVRHPWVSHRRPRLWRCCGRVVDRSPGTPPGPGRRSRLTDVPDRALPQTYFRSLVTET